jgi:hypothetical protein
MFHQKQKPWLPEICQIRKCHCHITLDFLGKIYQSTICLRLSGTFYLKILFIADKRECSPCIVQPNLWIVHRHQGTQQGMQVEGFSIIFHNQSLMNIQLLNICSTGSLIPVLSPFWSVADEINSAIIMEIHGVNRCRQTQIRILTYRKV